MIYNYLSVLLEIFSNAVNTILFIIVVFSSIKLILKVISLIKFYVKESNDIKRLKEGKLSLSDLDNLSPKEFQLWCASFLKKEGFIDISINNDDSYNSILCSKNDDTYYAECIKSYEHRNINYSVNIEYCRKLVGAMIGHNIKKGIIITTGVVTKEAMEYISSLPESYSITVYDGKALINEYNEYLIPTSVNA